MIKQIFFGSIVLFLNSKLQSQTCTVSVDSLMGTYKGECRNGKADGKGEAAGADAYTGEFKNGYPDGQGKYTWKNGNWYEGSWKKGLFDGAGSLNENITRDSLVVTTGFWKKGKYSGKYEKPFLIRSTTNNISNVDIRKLNATGSEISIIVKNITGGGASLEHPILPKARLTGIQVMSGKFEQQITDENSSTVLNKYTLRNLSYPFYAIFSFETTGSKLLREKVELEIFEAGSWNIQVNIDQ